MQTRMLVLILAYTALLLLPAVARAQREFSFDIWDWTPPCRIWSCFASG